MPSTTSLSRLRGRPRSQRGQALVEGAVGLSIVIMFLMLGLFLLVNATASIYYLLKLQAITQNTARFAANIRDDRGQLQQRVADYANNLLANSGLPGAQSITVNPDFSNYAVAVGINLGGLPLLGGKGVLPAVISLNTTEIAAASEAVVGYVRLEVEHGRQYSDSYENTPADWDKQPAYLPIVAAGKVDTEKKYMLDAINWPGTHVTYHGAYPDFPYHRGSRYGQEPPGYVNDVRPFYDALARTARYGGKSPADQQKAKALMDSIEWPYPCASKKYQVGSTTFTKCAIHGPACAPHWLRVQRNPSTEQIRNSKYFKR